MREDVARVKERGRQIMEAADPEGYQAMNATLSMLTDKIDSLQAMADNKNKILQVTERVELYNLKLQPTVIHVILKVF